MRDGRVEVVVLPSFPMIPATLAAFAGTPVAVGAQDLMWQDRGAFTGAVSGVDLRALGCRYVEVNHAERRRVFHEDDGIVRAKLAAAVRTGLVPIFCVGEREQGPVDAAVADCTAQLSSALEGVECDDPVQLVVAYEFRHESVESDAYAGEQRWHNHAGVIGYTGRFGATTLEASFRHDRNSVYGADTTGSVGLGYQLLPALKLRALAGTTFRALRLQSHRECNQL